jgi:hypothetical protein
MFGNLSIRPMMVGLLAVPVAAVALLGVDHLATRLRRTTETLLAMAGPDPAGRWARPVPLDRLLRAAVAEAEGFEHAGRGAPPGQGRRVDLLTTGEVEVAGAAGADLGQPAPGRPGPEPGCVPAQGPRGPAHQSDVMRLRRRARRDGPRTRPGQANFGRFPHCGGIDTDDSVPAPSSPAIRKVTADAS